MLIYVEPRPSTVMFRPGEQVIGGDAIVNHVLRRCRASLRSSVREYIVSAPAYAQLTHLDVGISSIVRPAGTGSLPEAVTAAFASLDVKTVLILPDSAIFVDLDLAQNLLISHHKLQSEVTVALGVPAGFAPIAMERSALPWFCAIAKQMYSVVDLQEALNKAPHRPLVIAGVKVCRLAVSNFILARLPEQLVMSDRWHVDAARKVFDRWGQQLALGSAPAVQLKEELLLARPTFRYSASPVSVPTVLFSSMQYSYSGGEESLLLLIKHLNPDRYRPIAWFPTETLLANRCLSLGVEVQIGDRDCSTLTAAHLDYFDSLVNRCSPSVIHIDGFDNPALMVVSRLRKIPVIGHVRMVLNRSEQHRFTLCDVLIGISEAVSQSLRTKNIAPSAVRTIYNGVDLKRFSPSEQLRRESRRALQIDQSAMVICHVGRITPNKQQHLLLESLPAVLATTPSVVVLMVGEIHDPEYWEYLKRTADRLNLTKTLKWLGFRPEIPKIYAASDMLVLTSLYEPFGRCIIEAMAMGVACVVPNRGGPAEIVVHNDTGLLFDPLHSTELEECLLRLCSSRVLRSRLAAAGAKRACDFDVHNHANQIQELYDQLRRRDLRDD